MNFATLVRARLTALGLGQKDLARATQVTDSYVSQLLTRRKPPPRPEHTDIYSRMESFLRVDAGELGRLADVERTEDIRRRLGQVPEPLFREFRQLVLRKCRPEVRDAVRAAFEARPFGTLERLVAQTLLKVAQGIARQQLDSATWMQLAARLGGRSHEEMRVIVLEFLDTDVFQVSSENCVAFIDPLVEGWDIDLDNLRLDVILNKELAATPERTFAFTERERSEGEDSEPVLAEFLADPRLSRDVTDGEIEILRTHRFGERRPTKLYYYRAVQSLRDSLHFEDA